MIEEKHVLSVPDLRVEFERKRGGEFYDLRAFHASSWGGMRCAVEMHVVVPRENMRRLAQFLISSTAVTK